MEMPSITLALVIGFVLINLTSYFIARKIRKHLQPIYAAFTHLAVALLALYYFVDALGHHPTTVVNPFSIFWFAIIFIQFVLFYMNLKRTRAS